MCVKKHAMSVPFGVVNCDGDEIESIEENHHMSS